MWENGTIEELANLAEDEMVDEKLVYKNLFKEDDTGGMGLFATKLLDQEKMERIKYIKEIELNLEGKR